MAKRGAKSKGGKGAKSKTTQTSKPSPASSGSSAASSVPEESGLPKCPPYEALQYAPTVTNEAVEGVQNLLGSPLRILLTDGRTIIGTLVNLDNYRNIILSNTYQAYLPATPGLEGSASTKSMGLILVPGNTIVKIEKGVKKLFPTAQ